VLVDSQAAALFTDSRLAATATQALALAPAAAARLRVCVELGDNEPPLAGFSPYAAWLDSQWDDSEPETQSVGNPMFYTSGTTGRPKGVLKLNPLGPPAMGGQRASAQGPMKMLQLPAQGITLLAGPYYHSAQWSFSFLPLLASSAVVMAQRFDAAQTLALIDAHSVTNLHLVPTQFIRLLRLDEATKRGFGGRTLVRVWHGAAPCPAQVKRDMITWWGPVIHEYYGSTEGAVVTGISSSEWLERPGSVGRCIGHTDVVIVRDDGSLAGADETGTIYLRDRRQLKLEYHNDPAKTAQAHRADGLFTTGDVGHVDAQGYLFLTDRKIDMIISGGVNIYPAEIEAALATHPAVQDAAVIGVPHAEMGEEVKAIVQLAAGFEASDDLMTALQQHCRAQLAGYKVPRSIDFCDAFPRTETGKLQKRVLRDAYWAGAGRSI
jgi:long-chain acyl-CoA synthetase